MRTKTHSMILGIASFAQLKLRPVGVGDITCTTFCLSFALVHVVSDNILDHGIEIADVYSLGCGHCTKQAKENVLEEPDICSDITTHIRTALDLHLSNRVVEGDSNIVTFVTISCS